MSQTKSIEDLQKKDEKVGRLFLKNHLRDLGEITENKYVKIPTLVDVLTRVNTCVKKTHVLIELLTEPS